MQENPFSTPSKEKKGAKRKRARSADLEPLEPDDAIESQFDEVFLPSPHSLSAFSLWPFSIIVPRAEALVLCS